MMSTTPPMPVCAGKVLHAGKLTKAALGQVRWYAPVKYYTPVN